VGNKMLVGFYDAEELKNVVSLLCGDYSAVTYVYFRHVGAPDVLARKRLCDFVRRRFGFSPGFLEIPENTMDAALEHLQTLADLGFCDFDITGGSPVFVAAAGALQMKLGRDRIGIHECDAATGCRTFCCPDRPDMRKCTVAALEVTEMLELRGIRLLDGEGPIRYEMNGELRREILRLWEAVRGDLQAWNLLATCPGSTEKTKNALLVEKKMNERQYGELKPMLDKMDQAGILSDLKKWSKGGAVAVSFRLDVPESARVLYRKGGNLLELLTCLAVENSGRFSDCCVGVLLDWDERNAHGTSNPCNELDVVATRGHIPCFISCKNTAVQNEYLYEIMTMTRHFGGRYAIPALVSTVENKPSVRARAAEMGVVLIDGVGEMTAEEFESQLRAALCIN